MRIRHVAFLLALSLSVAVAASAQSPAASLKTAAGQVILQRGAESSRIEAGTKLFAGDILTTGPASSAGLSFLDGTRVSLGPDSELHLNDFIFVPREMDFAFDVFLKKGSAAYSSGKLGKLAPAAIKISTPQTTVGIRGTKFLVKVE